MVYSELANWDGSLTRLRQEQEASQNRSGSKSPQRREDVSRTVINRKRNEGTVTYHEPLGCDRSEIQQETTKERARSAGPPYQHVEPDRALQATCKGNSNEVCSNSSSLVSGRRPFCFRTSHSMSFCLYKSLRIQTR